MSKLVAAALRCAARLGVGVVPIVGKRPAAEHGYGSATSEPERIRCLFDAAPRATGFGIAAADRLVIIDVDRADGLAELGPLPRTLTARSGGGGWHLYFLRPPGLCLSFRVDRFPAGIEVKLGATGTVAPPSVHPDTGRCYTWARWLPLTVAPTWLLGRLRCSAQAVDAPSFARQRVHGPTAYGRAVLDRKARLVAQAVEGTRHNALNGAAFACAQLIPSGHLEPDVVEEVLMEAAVSTGLPLLEIRRTIARALADGQTRPWFPGEAA